MIDHKIEELILSVKDISLNLSGKQILKDVSFDVHNITRPGLVQGQIISICGRSGCGKTSLFDILSGFNKPNSGTVKIDLDQHDVRKGEMGVVPQDYPLLGHNTIRRNFELALVKGPDSKKTIEEYAEYFNLTEQLEKYPCDLSGGQRQRASVLQQVLAGNRFILMDEPFSGLDCLMKDKMIDLLLKVANLNEYNTLIIVSHDIESACAISDTVHVMANNDGKGAKIIKTYDFIAEDLAYHEDIKEMPKFRAIIKEIKSIF